MMRVVLYNNITKNMIFHPYIHIHIKFKNRAMPSLPVLVTMVAESCKIQRSVRHTSPRLNFPR